MPYYDQSATHRVAALVAGIPTYLFGGWGSGLNPGLITSPTRFLITNVASTTSQVTITGSVIEGTLPAVGALVTVKGLQTNSGALNTTASTLGVVASTSLNINGVGTITYNFTNSGYSSVADSGLAIIPQAEFGDALSNGASIPCTMPVQDPKTDSARTINTLVAFPSLPTTATVVLQGAQFDQNSEYTTLGTVATVVGGAVTQGPMTQFQLNQARFYRFYASGVTGGTNPTIVGRVLV